VQQHTEYRGRDRREFGLDALEHVAGLSGDRLLEALEEAVAARVLIEVPRVVGRYRFSHALIRETLYDELSTTRRVRLHRQVGEALEGLYGHTPRRISPSWRITSPKRRRAATCRRASITPFAPATAPAR